MKVNAVKNSTMKINAVNNMTALQNTLKAAQLRNPDAYQVIGLASRIGKDRVKKIAEGKVKPSFMESATLETLA